MPLQLGLFLVPLVSAAINVSRLGLTFQWNKNEGAVDNMQIMPKLCMDNYEFTHPPPALAGDHVELASISHECRGPRMSLLWGA